MGVLIGNSATVVRSASLPVFTSHHHKLKPTMMSSANRCELKNRDDKTLVLTLTNKDDHHLLDPDFIKSIRERLDEAKSQATRGSVLITTAEGGSFCRGFDYSYARQRKKEFLEMGMDRCGGEDAWRQMIDGFEGLVRDLISLPMPTIAAVNGYATGAGLMLAISHDYLTINHRIGSVIASDHLTNESSLPAYFAALLRSKVSSPMNRRDLVLRNLEYNHEYAVKIGLISKKSSEKNDFNKQAKTLAADLSDLKLNGDVYVELRKAMLPDLCKLLGLTCTTISPKL